MKLSANERLKKALKKEVVDRPPCICPGGMMNMIVTELMEEMQVFWPEAHVNPTLMADLTEGMYLRGGFENLGVPFCMTVEAEGLGGKIDLGDAKTEPHMTEYVYASVLDYDKVPAYSLSSGRYQVVIDAIKLLKERQPDVPVVANLTGPISVASSLIDPMTFYKELRLKKEAAHLFVEKVVEHLIAFGRDQLEAGADVLVIADPSGTGEILGPKTFDSFVVTYMNRILDELKPYIKTGSIVHICGQLHPVFEQLKKLRSDGLSFDALVSIKKVQENVPDKSIMGNVNTFVLHNGDSKKVQLLGNYCLDAGVNILSPACGLDTRTSLENIKTLVGTAVERGYE